MIQDEASVKCAWIALRSSVSGMRSTFRGLPAKRTPMRKPNSWWCRLVLGGMMTLTVSAEPLAGHPGVCPAPNFLAWAPEDGRLDPLWSVLPLLIAMVLAAVFVLLMGSPWIRWLRGPTFSSGGPCEQRMAHRSSMGGVLIVLAILMVVTLLGDMQDLHVRGILLCLVLYGSLGTARDWRRTTIGPRRRLHGLQPWILHGCEAVILVVIALMASRHAGIGSFLAAITAIAVSTHSTYVTDGMDGLASGVVALIAAGLAVCWILETSGRSEALSDTSIQQLAVVCFAVVGACVAFLRFNYRPSRIFMGCSGSLPLGALLGYVAVATHREKVLAVMGGVLLLEMISVVLQISWFRVTGGKRLFRYAPLHILLTARGWSGNRVVYSAWIVTAVLVVIAIMLDRWVWVPR